MDNICVLEPGKGFHREVGRVSEASGGGVGGWVVGGGLCGIHSFRSFTYMEKTEITTMVILLLT